jgi:DNA polymerase elongation subunit (family B)
MPGRCSLPVRCHLPVVCFQVVTLRLPTMPLYGLDIETDTSLDGLDPDRSGVIAVAVCPSDGTPEEVITSHGADEEIALLRALDGHLAGLPPGVIVTWNGTRFDLPFLHRRATLTGTRIALTLGPATAWHGHRHLDAWRVYRSLTTDRSLSCSLKAVARRVGLDPIEEDPKEIHLLDEERLRRYVASDARLARLLAERVWHAATAFIDGTDEALCAPPPLPGRPIREDPPPSLRGRWSVATARTKAR